MIVKNLQLSLAGNRADRALPVIPGHFARILHQGSDRHGAVEGLRVRLLVTLLRIRLLVALLRVRLLGIALLISLLGIALLIPLLRVRLLIALLLTVILLRCLPGLGRAFGNDLCAALGTESAVIRELRAALCTEHVHSLLSGILLRPFEREGRKQMALAQYIAGQGFSNVGLGIAHSMAHTLGAHYDTPHGVACAMFLPIVMEYNQEYTGERFREIARAMGVEGVDSMTQAEYRKAAIDAVRQLSVDVGIPVKNEKIREEDLKQLADEAYADACRPGNPRDASAEDMIELYRKLM